MSEIFLLYIAIVVAFFLLGIILGTIINPNRKPKKMKEKPLSETVKDNPGGNQKLGQEKNENAMDLQDSPYQKERRHGYYNSNNYGNSFYGQGGRNRMGPR